MLKIKHRQTIENTNVLLFASICESSKRWNETKILFEKSREFPHLSRKVLSLLWSVARCASACCVLSGRVCDNHSFPPQKRFSLFEFSLFYYYFIYTHIFTLPGLLEWQASKQQHLFGATVKLDDKKWKRKPSCQRLFASIACDKQITFVRKFSIFLLVFCCCVFASKVTSNARALVVCSTS